MVVIVLRMVVLGLLFGSQLGEAKECFQSSPSIDKGVDPKTEITVRAPDKQEYKGLRTLLDRMTGNWKGKAVEIRCKGNIKSPVEEEETYEVEAKVIQKRPHITLSLESTWYSARKKSTRLEDLSLHLTKDFLRVNSEQAAGDLEFLKVNDNFLAFLKKNIIRNPAGGVIAQEVVRTIALINDALMIEYQTYINGILVARSEWQLKRK